VFSFCSWEAEGPALMIMVMRNDRLAMGLMVVMMWTLGEDVKIKDGYEYKYHSDSLISLLSKWRA